MANQTRVRTNSITGTVGDNPLSNAATTLNSTQLIALPAVDATQHMALVLDPTGAGNGPEIVWVTGHTAGTSSATIVRGREGTSAVQHTSTRTWIHAPTQADFVNHITSSTRPSGSGLPYQGQICYETDTDRWIYWDGTAWEIMSSPWTAYVPTLTQSNSLTNTVTSARYRYTGIKTVQAIVKLTITGTGTAANAILVGLPVAHALPAITQIGGFIYTDNSAPSNLVGSAITATGSGGTTVAMVVESSTATSLGAEGLVTAANGDTVSINVSYETT